MGKAGGRTAWEGRAWAGEGRGKGSHASNWDKGFLRLGIPFWELEPAFLSEMNCLVTVHPVACLFHFSFL